MRVPISYSLWVSIGMYGRVKPSLLQPLMDSSFVDQENRHALRFRVEYKQKEDYPRQALVTER